ncbi:glutaredoxin family protein [Neptunicella marina]|uniref:Glutaredoxin family protein n=1 Tax=Neptunicella marina TaxID=2125989 RepID=A0A8J6J037_9ALTE|nr:glutaredoxin family protein [Neptunicella marina]MBC3767508.1 glutaredoxin family protein [Neptunicella marina]
MQTEIILYSTSGCHLCEQAAELLNQTQPKVKWQTVDIAFDDDLFGRYGIRIPVIFRQDNQQELGWPFDAALLTEFLS